jgi:hypothetical protein
LRRLQRLQRLRTRLRRLRRLRRLWLRLLFVVGSLPLLLDLAPDYVDGLKTSWSGVQPGHWRFVCCAAHGSLRRRRSRRRAGAGAGAKNMAVVRHFALNLVCQVVDKRSIKRRRCDVDSLPWICQNLLPVRHDFPTTANDGRT